MWGHFRLCRSSKHGKGIPKKKSFRRTYIQSPDLRLDTTGRKQHKFFSQSIHSILHPSRSLLALPIRSQPHNLPRIQQPSVSGSIDNTVRLWDASTCAAVQTLKGHSDSVELVAFSQNSKVEPALFVANNWVVEGGADILWLPPDSRVIYKAIPHYNAATQWGSGDGKQDSETMADKQWIQYEIELNSLPDLASPSFTSDTSHSSWVIIRSSYQES